MQTLFHKIIIKALFFGNDKYSKLTDYSLQKN